MKIRRTALVGVIGLGLLALGAITVVNLATQVTGVLPTANGGCCAITKGGIGTAVLTPGTTVSVDFSTATVFTLTPAQAETINAVNCTAGESGSIIVTTSGTSSFVLTFSTNFKTTGTLTTGTTTAKVFNISFACNGSTATEMSRTVAM